MISVVLGFDFYCCYINYKNYNNRVSTDGLDKKNVFIFIITTKNRAQKNLRFKKIKKP